MPHPRLRVALIAAGLLLVTNGPLLFFAGVYVPRPFMSDGVLAISNLTPIGAPVQAMMDAWEGMTPEPLHLIVALGYTLVFGVLAIRLFRWE